MLPYMKYDAHDDVICLECKNFAPDALTVPNLFVYSQHRRHTSKMHISFILNLLKSIVLSYYISYSKIFLVRKTVSYTIYIRLTGQGMYTFIHNQPSIAEQHVQQNLT
jgi:hypothetical protein